MLIHDYKPPAVIVEPSKYPLPIELVPETAWRKNLRGLIPNSQWDKIKEAVFDIAGRRCEVCAGAGRAHPVECHERWRVNEAKRLLTLDRLVALCPDCHAATHLGFALKNKSPAQFQRVREHCMRVNGLTGDQMDKYVELAFSTQRSRRDMQWVFDLAWLEKHFVFSWSKKALASNALIRNARA